MRKPEKKKFKIADIIKEHVQKNTKEYLIISIIFLIGIVIGIIFVNNINIEQKNEIQQYIGNFTQSLNENYQIDSNNLLKTSIINNLILVLVLWFIGSTVIGIPILYIVVCFKGFSLGYAISSIMITYPFWRGVLFSISTLLLQNLIIIPCIIALAVSGMKLYKSIIKDRRKNNIKVEIIKHTFFSSGTAIFLVLASFIESYVSSNLLMLCSNLY